MDIQLTTYANGVKFEDRGSEVPRWASDTRTANSWSLPNSDYGISKNGNDVYIQYGKNEYGWASIRYWKYNVEVVEQHLRDDNSLDVTVRLTMNFWRTSEAPSRGSGYRVIYNLFANGQKLLDYTGRTIDNINLSSGKSITFNVNVPPGQYSNASALNVTIQYPNGEYVKSSSFIGVRLYNPNPVDPDIKPWAIRKSGVFKTLDRESGFFKIRHNGTWEDKSKMKKSQQGAENVGVSRIRKSNKWLGQSKIGQD